MDRLLDVIKRHPFATAVSVYLGVTFGAAFVNEWVRLRDMARDIERDFSERADEIAERMSRAHAEEWKA